MDSTTLVATLPNTDKRYTFRVPVELAVTLAKGDKVLADTAFGVTIMELVGVHKHDQYDPDAGFEWKWVFARVPLETLDQLKSQEDQSFLE